MKKNNKGFTLVELIIVIAIIAILAVVVAPQYLKYVENSRIATDENTLDEIAHAAEIAAVGDGNTVIGDGNFQISIAAGGVATCTAGTDPTAAEGSTTVPSATLASSTISTGAGDAGIIDISSYKFKSEKYSKEAKTIYFRVLNGVGEWKDSAFTAAS